MNDNELIKQILLKTIDIKAENACCYNLIDSEWITDYAIIIGAKNTIHCNSLKEIIINFLKEKKSEIDADSINTKGSEKSGWIIIDLGSIICHCITQVQREKYTLDDLYRKKTNIVIY